MFASLSQTLVLGSDQSAIWICLLIFIAILAGAIFIPTFIPDSSILILSGILAKNGHVTLSWLLFAAITGAYIGYDLDYWSGRIFGLAVCKKRCPRIFGEKILEQIRKVMERYGSWSIIISRFIPILNLPPFFAGIYSMAYRSYILWNLLGAFIYCGSLILFGYYLGGLEIVSNYRFVLVDLVILIFLVSLVYAVLRFIRGHRIKRRGTGEIYENHPVSLK
jgi:membrane-associated protein